MVKRTLARFVVACTGVVALLATGATAAHAAAPANDDFATATVVTSLPYTTTIDTSDATSDGTDPTECFNNGSVWFRYTPSADARIRVDTTASDYRAVVSAWTGEQGALAPEGCTDYRKGALDLRVTAGTTYYLMVGLCCGNGADGGGSLNLSVTEVVPPVNDAFDDASTVAALPYENRQDFAAATAQAGEPTSCFASGHTVWYAYTPTTTRTLTARTAPDGLGVAVYTGTALGGLTQVACRGLFGSGPVSFEARAGTTYLFQVGSYYDDPATFQLDVAPNPEVDFFVPLTDPNTFDSNPFYPSVSDPAGLGVTSFAWDFGDGTTSTGQYPNHRFTADGDYTVKLTAGTPDGRSASASHTVAVRTHDVAIVRLKAPSSAKVGQTVKVQVELRNTRYPEDVEVQLSRSDRFGFTPVDLSRKLVPVLTGGKTTVFTFNYTITEEDRALGKVSFSARAALVGKRDALPADNELISTPVRIS
ncbi:PKD domain-containing protein [Micromonospora sp. NPDC000089]|uniref:PKD domain-containing protein n=1 Tax=unclassified Micromonospora TaxID=2617518 RepID=UPI0036D02F8E